MFTFELYVLRFQVTLRSCLLAYLAMSISSIQAGRVICDLSGWKASNLRMQKLLYIAHMLYTGTSNKIEKYLIREDFEAWKYGPVEPELYYFCCDFGADPISDVFPYHDTKNENKPEYDILKKVVGWAKNKSEKYLVGYTHWEHGAWVKRDSSRKEVIPYEMIKEEYNIRKAMANAKSN